MTDKRERIETIRILKEGNVPCFDFPGAAARALAALTRYGTILRRELGNVRRFEDVDRPKAAAILDKVHEEGRTTLFADEAYGVLEAYAVPVADWFIAWDAHEAAKLATRLGFPVAVKVDSPSIVHKSEAGGVAVDLRDAEAVQAAVLKMGRSIKDPQMRFLVQRYLPVGKEIIVGARAAGNGLGHIVMCGLGGIHVEVLKDVNLKLSPVTDIEAAEMFSSLRAAPILKGVRNGRDVDQRAIAEVIQRVSQMVTDFPAIQEMDLNPLLAFEEGVCAADARIHL